MLVRMLIGLSLLVSQLALADNLRSALAQVDSYWKQGRAPVAVFDLDETLVNSHFRKLLAYRDAVEVLAPRFPKEAKAAAALTVYDFTEVANGYDITEIFKRIGVTNAAFIKEVDALMLPIYLSDKYMDFDSELPCATAFIRELQLRGVFVYFVSSRYKETQLEGTERSLLRMGMVRKGDSFEVILRPKGMSSIDFKTQTFQRIARQDVALAFENEPENLNAMGDVFPEAGLYFVKGAEMKAEPFRKLPVLIGDYCR